MTLPDNPQWEFGSFRLDGVQHLLFRGGELVPLSRKATDLLLVLLENHGQLVEKETLMTKVWPDSFVEESNLAVHISLLRKTLSEENSSHRIETIPRRGYRFVGEVTVAPASVSAPTPRFDQPASEESTSREKDTFPRSGTSNPSPVRAKQMSWRWIAVSSVFAICLAGGAAIGIRHLQRPKPAATVAATPREMDTVVLADIANNTGDPVFDTTLRRAMAIELEQSPYLRLVPEAQIQRSYLLMGKAAGGPLSPDQWRELCQRNGSSAVLDGWIAKLQSQYVLGLRAINCRTGDHIADLETSAAGKDLVLKALGDLTGQLRTRLGESLSTVQKFDTPIEEATTPSLEALQAYSIGMATVIQKGESSAGVPFFQRAIRLDPDFAIAHAALGNAYFNMGETGLAADNTRRAYELRRHVSERERLYIESHYYQFVIGDLTKAAGIYESWAATYPDDVIPRTDLALIDMLLGRYDRSLDDAKAALRIAPDDCQNYCNLANHYISLNELKDARTIIDQAHAQKMESSDLHLYIYDIAFLQNDAAARQEQLNWAAGEPGFEDLFLGHEADTLAFEGMDAKARGFTNRAVDVTRKSGEKETAAGYEVDAAQREAVFGNYVEARRLAQEALTLAHDRDTKYGAAAALALAGSLGPANAIADELNKDFPDDTLVQFVYLPTVRGAIAVGQKDPARAIGALDAATPYELGVGGELLPVYVRGLACLDAGDGRRAQTEFEKIIAYPGVVLFSPYAPLARLQLARAYQLQGDRTKASAAYLDFLTRWKDADPNLPILRAAKAESAKLSTPVAR